MRMTYGLNDKVPLAKAVPLALQHVFTIFTGTIIGSTLLASGAGLTASETGLIIQCGMLVCCVASLIQSFGIRIGRFQIGSKLPIITSGSYTLITPLVMFATDKEIGLAGAFGAAIGGSFVLFLLGPVMIKYLHKFFTPAVTGTVVLSVGLSLVTTAVQKMVAYDPESPNALKLFIIAMGCAVLTILIDMFAKGFLQSLAILIAMSVGYVVCIALGLVDFSSMGSASWISVPVPFHWGIKFMAGPILTICVVHIATLMENIGDTTSIVSNAEDRMPTRDELIHTIRGDALGSVFGGIFNGLPVCSATQNAGVLAMSGCASRYVTGLGAMLFGVLAFFPKFSQILALIPDPVLGGVLLVAFGTIIASGIRVIGMDKLTKRGMTIVGVAIAAGIGGQYAGDYLSFIPTTVLAIFTGISGSAITALILNIVLPRSEEDKAFLKEFAQNLVSETD